MDKKKGITLFLSWKALFNTSVLRNKIKAEGFWFVFFFSLFSVLGFFLFICFGYLIVNLFIAVHHYQNASCSILGIVLLHGDMESLESFLGETQGWISRCSWAVCDVS